MSGRKCHYPTKYGDTICVDGTLWELTYSEMGPPDSRQNAGPCPYCAQPRACAECGINPSDPPSSLCPACEAYQEHQR